MLLLLALLATISLLAVAAFNTATITSSQSLKVVSTNEALISLIPQGVDQVGNKDSTAYVDDQGELVFRFGWAGGTTGAMKGLQPRSQYTWGRLFTIHNRSSENVLVTTSVSGDFSGWLTLVDADDAGTVFVTDGTTGPGKVLVPDAQVTLSITVEVPQGAALGLSSGTIRVNAVAQ